MTAPEDPGHLLPDEDWAAVVAAAELEAQRITAGHRAPEAPTQLLGAGRYATGALPLSGQVHAPRNGGPRGGAPTFGVLHSAETPLVAGYAASIARMFATTKVDKSCHYMVDPAETWGVLPDELIAWHVGNGNRNSLALEQAGYARFSRAEWMTPAGLAQMDRVAAIMRAARDRYGIGLYWMTDQQLRDAHARRIVGGWATHDQCRVVLGGTTHTDPMPNYPLDPLMARANGKASDMPTADEFLSYPAWHNGPELRQHNLDVHNALKTLLTRTADVQRGSAGGEITQWQDLANGVTNAEIAVQEVRAIRALLESGGVDADAVADRIAVKLEGRLGLTRDDVTAAIREVFADGGQA